MAGRIYTIPSHMPFLQALANGVLARYGQGGAGLADVTILLPNRRSSRALKEAFMQAAGGQALILPVIHGVGDVEEDLLDVSLSAVGEAALELPPAVDSSRRRLLLARLIEEWARAQPEGHPHRYIAADHAVRLAAELGALLDEMQRENIQFSRLSELVDDQELAQHWQITLDFLQIIGEGWPGILKEHGAMDAVPRRNRLLELQARAWQLRPPPGPVIAAGTTGSMPAVRELLKSVLGLEHGMLVLPGLDKSMPEDMWRHVGEGHPQAGMKHLLDALGFPRDAVNWWDGCAEAEPPRQLLLREAMRPADITEGWRGLTLPPGAAEGLTVHEVPTQQQEAEVVALLLRDVLETPGKTACLVTPDRRLARRVATLMLRWGVEVDDSAGKPLGEVPSMVFLRLLAQAATQAFAPVSLLALLKHPLASGGLPPAQFRAKVRLFEKAVLRGVQPALGLAGIEALLEGHALAPWFAQVAEILRPVERIAQQGERLPLTGIMEVHLTAANALATTPGEERLWLGEDGQFAAQALEEMLDAATDAPPLDPLHYPGVFDALVLGMVYRPAYRRHPRIAILSPMEARLQQFDRMVIGSFNQGTWPREGGSPWMSRRMAHTLGLMGEVRRIGLSVHDFVSFASAPEVFITRARKVDGAPVAASMFLLRLMAVLAAGGQVGGPGPWATWSAACFTPAHAVTPLVPPAPCPPVEARPRELPVTQIEKLMRDPYAVYAGKVLRLRPLDPLEQDPGAADFGNYIHRALEFFVKRGGPGKPPAEAASLIRSCGEEAFLPLRRFPSVFGLWWPRFEKVAEWLLQHEAKRFTEGRQMHAEVKGHMEIMLGEGGFVLTAKADRLELEGHSATIIDYKTGGVPAISHAASGYSPQLVLEGLMAMAGAFDGVSPAAEIKALEYWKTGVGSGLGTITSIPYDPSAIEGLTRLLSHFLQADAPYLAAPDPHHAPTYNDFEHLERLKEWR